MIVSNDTIICENLSLFQHLRINFVYSYAIERIWDEGAQKGD
jgi:hypothetical protein